MSHHNHQCWNCGHSYDTVLFEWKCPDCQALFDNDPKIIELRESMNKGNQELHDRLHKVFEEILSQQPVAMYYSIPDISSLDEDGLLQYIVGVDPITNESVREIMDELNDEELRHDNNAETPSDNNEQLPF